MVKSGAGEFRERSSWHIWEAVGQRFSPSSGERLRSNREAARGRPAWDRCHRIYFRADRSTVTMNSTTKALFAVPSQIARMRAPFGMLGKMRAAVRIDDLSDAVDVIDFL
jgi:hypothetical protein